MKYLKLFEAFESDAISKLIKYYNVKSNDAQEFLNDLRQTVLENYGLPIDKISNSDVKYLPAKQAKKIKGGEVSNPFGVYALKFWFSIEKGYLGFSGVGEIREDENSFSKSELNYIKDDLDIKKGKLVPIDNWSKLKTGDKIIGYFSQDESSRYLTLGTFYLSGDLMFGIQDVSDGGYPDGREWRTYGRYSWNLGEVDSPASDHSKMHLYIESDDDLSIENIDVNTDLLVSSNGGLTNRYKQRVTKMLEDSDFAIVLYIDGLLKDETVPDIRKWRQESKSGATALMSDKEIKQTNIKRYIDKIITMYGLNLDTTEKDLRNLQNLVRTILCDKNIFFAFWLDNPSVDRIGNILRKIELLFNSDDKEYRFDSLRDQFRNYREDSKSSNLRYEGSKKRVLSNANENVLDVFNKIYELSSKINDVISSQKIENIDDLEILQYKLELLRKFIKDGRIQFSDSLEYALNNFHYNDGDVDRGVERANNENMSTSLKKIEQIEKFIQSTFN